MPARVRTIGLAFLCVHLAVSAAHGAETGKVLIAAQTSPVKDAVVARVAETLRGDGHPVRVIGLEQLATEPSGGYRAILLVNSCYAWRPTAEVRDFVGRASDEVRRKIVVVTTANSGRCDFKAPGVDHVSAASKRTHTEELSTLILDRLRERLAAP